MSIIHGYLQASCFVPQSFFSLSYLAGAELARRSEIMTAREETLDGNRRLARHCRLGLAGRRMMPIDATWPFWLALCVAVYAVLAYRLKAGAQPLRLTLAKEGEALLASPHLSRRGRSAVIMMLDNAFSFRKEIFFMFLATPYVAVHDILLKEKRSVNSRSYGSVECTSKVNNIKLLHVTITFCNHPLSVTILFVWMGAWLILCTLVKAAFGSVPVLDGNGFAFATADQASRIGQRRSRKQDGACPT